MKKNLARFAAFRFLRSLCSSYRKRHGMPRTLYVVPTGW